MRVQQALVDVVDPDAKWLHRVGGVSALALGIGYLVIMGLYVPMGAPPTGAEARLAYIAANTPAWWAILWLSVLTDLLFVPVAFALYLALKHINRSVMLFAAACVGLFVILDLALTWTNYAVLIQLAEQFNTAATDAQRAVIVATAHYPAAVLESTLLFVYNTLTLSVGILLAGLVMLKGRFGKVAAYVGLATGLLGIVAVFGPLLVSALSFTIILASLGTTVWALLAGFDLVRLGRR